MIPPTAEQFNKTMPTPTKRTRLRPVREFQAQHQSTRALNQAYDRFMNEREPSRKQDAGKDLIRAIFGKE